MLTLYFSPGSSAMATHGIALHEVGAKFEDKIRRTACRRKIACRTTLALNPEGKVPTLLIDGHILTEVAGTLYYLARRFPEAGLLPAGDIEAEAQVVSWMSFVASTIHPARRVGPRPPAGGFRDSGTKAGRPDLDCWRLLDRRHSFVPVVLALDGCWRAGTGKFPRGQRALRPHDAAACGAPCAGDRIGGRLQPAGLARGRFARPPATSSAHRTAPRR